ncbi:hypothetical protein SAMN05216319_0066 [Duganella sp. CF402]|uniref:hypothetical protein n=1 Tax=unclassified Duganella TaxID=2636909 RepID=UPI0008D5E16D|nr:MULTISPECIES: hypothetical protein [unclassified Duganella]RZT11449.1 hypothetical protein EV582_3560 [Duganella sp. BK701]SEK64035.1 hypothetical protein SAMN05216319_0066 [Duganella sp. CF402]
MPQPDKENFENAIKSLEATTTSVGVHLEVDSTARRIYAREIKAMSDNLRSDVAKGKLSWAEAAEQAQTTRNVIMQLTRSRTTPVARAFAERAKAEGQGLNALIAEKTVKLYGKSAVFAKLTQSRQNRVFAEVVASAGRSRLTITGNVRRFSYLGRSLILLSLALSTYNVLTARNKSAAIKHELVTTTAGVSGSIAAGAIAGLACGPGAPVCVTIGAFAGGALAAFGAGFIW